MAFARRLLVVVVIAACGDAGGLHGRPGGGAGSDGAPGPIVQAKLFR